jgi:hypothetical protein
VATASYVKHVLPGKDDEQAVLGRSLAEMTAELPALTAEVGSTYEVRDAYEHDNTHGWGTVPEPEDAPPPAVRRETTLKPVVARPRARLSAQSTPDVGAGDAGDAAAADPGETT